jgi:hypothetical protein
VAEPVSYCPRAPGAHQRVRGSHRREQVLRAPLVVEGALSSLRGCTRLLGEPLRGASLAYGRSPPRRGVLLGALPRRCLPPRGGRALLGSTSAADVDLNPFGDKVPASSGTYLDRSRYPLVGSERTADSRSRISLVLWQTRSVWSLCEPCCTVPPTLMSSCRCLSLLGVADT